MFDLCLPERRLYIRDDCPEVLFVETGNASENTPMNAINTAMGYRKFRDEWLGKVELSSLQRTKKSVILGTMKRRLLLFNWVLIV